MIKAIIFDCFGVLVKEWLAIVAEPYPEQTRQALWDAVKASNMGYIDYEEGIKQMAEVLGMSEEALLEFRTKNEIHNQELVDYIASLQDKGYKTAVLSNVSAGGISRRFTHEEQGQLFNVVVESGSIGVAKPDINAYLYTAKLLDCRPDECIMIDDREDFCAGAEVAGMSSILYTQFAGFKKELEQLIF